MPARKEIEKNLKAIGLTEGSAMQFVQVKWVVMIPISLYGLRIMSTTSLGMHRMCHTDQLWFQTTNCVELLQNCNTGWDEQSFSTVL